MAKKFYWLKLPKDFFTDVVIKKLKQTKDGYIYAMIYLELLLLSLEDEGSLFFETVEEDFYSELALKLDEEREDVETTVNYLLDKKLLEIKADDEYFLTRAPEMIGAETNYARQKRRQREREKKESVTMSHSCHGDVTGESGQCPPDVHPMSIECQKMSSRDRDRDKERTRDISRDIDTDQIASRLNELIGHSEYTSEYISHIRKEDLPKFMEMVEQSDWLKENLNRYQEPNPKFIENVLKGKYITYGKSHNKVEKKPKQPKPGVANSQTSKYSGEDLNAMARRKFLEFQNKAHGGGNNDSI